MTNKIPDPQRVMLIDYDWAWVNAYSAEARYLSELIGNDIADIAHFGSTAIPGMKAKPVIDVLVQLVNGKSLEGDYAHTLEENAYIERIFNDGKQRRMFTKGNGAYRTHNIHITTFNSDFARDMLVVRDRMRASPLLAKEYAELKENLVRNHADDNQAYYKAKTSFLERITYG